MKFANGLQQQNPAFEDFWASTVVLEGICAQRSIILIYPSYCMFVPSLTLPDMGCDG